MALIYETENFIVESADKPHITRTDGGHVRVLPKVSVHDRTQLSPSLAIELMRLTMMVGEAMAQAMNRRGIDVERINYQDMGNWTVNLPEGPHLHIQVYGRARSAKFQPWGEAVHLPQRSTGFYDAFEPLNQEDITVLRDTITKLLGQPKYQDALWHL